MEVERPILQRIGGEAEADSDAFFNRPFPPVTREREGRRVNECSAKLSVFDTRLSIIA
jgi:hypothetical protein